MYEFLDRFISIAAQELEILEDYHQKVLMVLEITILVLQNKLYFQKLIMIKLKE